jgi:hypothetical protein
VLRASPYEGLNVIQSILRLTSGSLVAQESLNQRNDLRRKPSMDASDMARGQRCHTANPGVFVSNEFYNECFDKVSVVIV